MFGPWRRVTTERTSLALVVVATAAVGVVACGSSSDNATRSAGAPKADKTLRIAYVPGVSPFPYFDTAVRGVKEAAGRLGWKVDYVAVPDYDPAAQTKALDATLAQRPDALLVSPDDPVALRAPIQRFLSAGIPVITVGGNLNDSSGLVSSIVTDNYQGGVVAGEGLGKILAGKTGSVAVVGLTPGNPQFQQRVDGFAAGLKKLAPDVKPLPVEYAGQDPAKSQTVTRALLLAHHDLIGVYGVAEVNGEGAAAAIKAVGKTGTIPVATFDGSPAEVKALRDGTIQVLSVSKPYAQGQLAVELLRKHVSGDVAALPKVTKVGNVEVTKANLDDPAIKQTLYTSGD